MTSEITGFIQIIIINVSIHYIFHQPKDLFFQISINI